MKGVLKTWKEDRGFGFITPDNGGRDVFIHISAIGQASRRPVPGDVVHYQVARDKQGKFRAINAYIEGLTVNGGNVSESSGMPLWVLLTLLVLGLLAGGVWYYFRSGGTLPL